MKRLIIILSLFSISQLVLAQEPSIKLECVPDSVQLGSAFQCSCVLSLPSGASWRSLKLPMDSIKVLQGLTPGADTIPADFEILDHGIWSESEQQKYLAKDQSWQATTQDGFDIYQNTFRFVLWQPGVFLLPPLVAEVSWNNGEYEVLSNEHLFYVSLPNPDQLNNLDSTGLAPIKPIVLTQRKIDWLFWGAFLLGILIAIGVIIYLVKRSNQRTYIPPPVIPISAHEKAYKALDKIERQADWTKGEFKKYYDELTHVLRQYLEDRYEVPALESTTDEILRDLNKTDIPDVYKTEMRRLLPMTDMVKFAKAQPHDEEHPAWLSWVRSLVDSTRKEIINIEENDLPNE